VQGEADHTIVPIVRGVVEGSDIRQIKGVMHRTGDRTLLGAPIVRVNPIALVDDMDALPRPDFDDFFDQFRRREYAKILSVYLPIENSRGCWWGAKHHCTFCGLNSNSMAFRRKRAETVFEELVTQSARYDNRSFVCVDSILEMSYFNDLLPRLRDAGLGLRMFYEVKANLTRRQVQLLADAGITLLQPGLEHLSTEVLALMRKGTTFLQNVQLLKWSRERNLTVFWSVLYGFPGETLASYEEMASRIPSLHHLFPPKLPVRVRIDRFSPLFTTPQALGLSTVFPARSYRHVYPFDEPALRGLAYHFEGEYARRPPDLNNRIYNAIAGPIAEWNERFFRNGASLDYVSGSRHLIVRDTRASSTGRYLVLDTFTARILDACDSATTSRHLESVTPDVKNPIECAFEDMVIDMALQQAEQVGIPVVQSPPTVASAADAVAWLLEQALLVQDGDKYLGLPSAISPPERLLDLRPTDPEALRNMAATRKVVLEGVA
jgi:ribosomal peptide maturation radical SAM protein 1